MYFFQFRIIFIFIVKIIFWVPSTTRSIESLNYGLLHNSSTPNFLKLTKAQGKSLMKQTIICEVLAIVVVSLATTHKK